MATATKKKTVKKTAIKNAGHKKKKNGKGTKKGNNVSRDNAKKIGITLPQLNVLTALSKSSEGLSYHQIKAKTGYYSILTAIMRIDHENSLSERKLIKEEVHDINGRDTLVFKITAAGKKAID